MSTSPDSPVGDRSDETHDPWCTNPPGDTVDSAETTPSSRVAIPREVFVPGYESLGELGRGGMGVVFKAKQSKLNRIVALKMILAGDLATKEHRRRFQAEAEMVAQLVHPHIVQIYEVGEHDNRPYFSLEFVPGQTLSSRLAGKPQPFQWSAELMEILARAVQAAHERGIIHRDLKPGNVLMADDRTPKIADFGLAKQMDSQQYETQTGMVMGTPGYMSPEQAFGRSRGIGPATDIHALGAILYEMLTGRPPFRGEDLSDTLHQIRYLEPVPPRDLRIRLPRDLDTICLKCLQKDPNSRYESAAALADDLQRYLRGEPIVARPISSLERGWRWVKRYPLVAGLSATVLLVIALSLAIVSTQLVLRIAAQRRWVDGQVDALLAASEESIPFILRSLNEFPQYSVERLTTLYDDSELTRPERLRVAVALLKSKPQIADDLPQLLNGATPGEVRVLSDEFLRQGVDASKLNQIESAGVSENPGDEETSDRLAEQRANVAIVAARLGNASRLWPLLKAGPDNSVRSHVVNRWGLCGGSAEVLGKRLADTGIAEDERRALLLALGSIPLRNLPDEKRAELVDQLNLIEAFEHGKDSGTHAAIRWLLGQWGYGEQVRNIESRLAGKSRGDADWYVTIEGQTMSVLGPATFPMGTPAGEQQRDDVAEQLHECRIGRRFSIAQQEVTIDQLRRSNGERAEKLGGPDSIEPDCPARLVTWSDAAAYCNWLSDKSGIARDQWCYVPNPANPAQLVPAPNYLQRTGFRLPTEAEWEFACRAGTSTPRFFGYSVELLPQYAWCLRKDPSGAKGPVATLLPNDFGLFDVYGNANEWCNDGFVDYPSDQKFVDDQGGEQDPRVNPIRILRGLAAGDVAIPRSGLRDRGLYTETAPAIGFRIARTEAP